MATRKDPIKLLKKAQYLKKTCQKTTAVYIPDWIKMRAEWEDYYNKNNDYPTLSNNNKLYQWQKYQNTKFEAGLLTNEQIDALNKTNGWFWDDRAQIHILQKKKEDLLKEVEDLQHVLNAQLLIMQQNTDTINSVRKSN